MNIDVSFITEYNTICGVLKIFLNEILLSKDKIRLMVGTLQTDLDNKFRDIGKIQSSILLEKLQNIFGESASVSIDLNLSSYGDEVIEDMLLNDIGGEHKVSVSINFKRIYVDEEGSENKIEEIIREEGITFY